VILTFNTAEVRLLGGMEFAIFDIFKPDQICDFFQPHHIYVRHAKKIFLTHVNKPEHE